MTIRQTYRKAWRRACGTMRGGLLWLTMLGMLSLTACDLSSVFQLGGDGRSGQNQGQRGAEATREDIETIQKALAELGYAPGVADGIVGPATRSAIRGYQNEAGLPVDGDVSLALLESLRTNPAKASATLHGWTMPDGTVVNLPPPDTGSAVAKDDIVIDSENDELAPVYEIGDVVAWSDGLVETVVRVGGKRVFWRGSNGTSFNADPNFVVPPSSWDGADGPGNAKTSVDAARLWPLPKNKRVNFRVSTSGPSGEEIVRNWTCWSRGQKKVTVPAGTFDTLVITCSRDRVSKGEWRHRTWFYAPAARHYVRRVDRFADGSIQAVGLVAIRPGGKGWPAAARGGLDWAIQDTLNQLPNGTGFDWDTTSVRASFRIMPTGSRKTVDGRSCRTFVILRKERGDSRSYPAIACKDGETGTWLVPVLDEGAVPANEIASRG